MCFVGQTETAIRKQTSFCISVALQPAHAIDSAENTTVLHFICNCIQFEELCGVCTKCEDRIYLLPNAEAQHDEGSSDSGV
jgi:hypothetical protein